MIVYHNILRRLSENGWTTKRLQTEHLIRAGRAITTTTIDTICRLCECQPGDLMSYVPDETQEKEQE